MLRLVTLLSALAFAGAASAADITVQVRDQTGQPVADAVVLIHAPGQGPARFAWPMVMSQHDIAFEPHTLIVPVGAEVAFPNNDKVRHHVYSFSAPKRFELKLYGRDETRSVRFDKPGPVALGCNIHDRMSGFIYVADTPLAAKTGANGAAVLHGVPSGPVQLTVWHPFMRAAQNQLERSLAVSGDATEAISADLRAAKPR